MEYQTNSATTIPFSFLSKQNDPFSGLLLPSAHIFNKSAIYDGAVHLLKS